jgi:hypothetical protein
MAPIKAAVRKPLEHALPFALVDRLASHDPRGNRLAVDPSALFEQSKPLLDSKLPLKQIETAFQFRSPLFGFAADALDDLGERFLKLVDIVARHDGLPPV